MPTKEQRAASRAAREAARNPGAAASNASKPEKTPLADPVVQDEILNPQPKSVVIAGKEYVLRPLSARQARKFNGFAAQVINDALAATATAPSTNNPSADKFVLANRISGIVAERYDERFLPFVALAAQPPGDLSLETVHKLAEELLETATAGDVAKAFIVLYNQNTERRADAKNA